MKRALVVGSVAIDVLFDVHGTIKERIALKSGKLEKQNLMFTAEAKVERFGGTGANIAYGLGLLGANPILFASVGKDFKYGFEQHLLKNGVLPKVYMNEQAFTATYYGMSDKVREQIGVWQPNAHDALEALSITDYIDANVLAEVSVAIFSGKPEIALRYMEQVRKILGDRVITIFDPGQMIAFYSSVQLKKSLKLADIVIVNDDECVELLRIMKCESNSIFKFGPKALIETRGGDGSVLYEKESATEINAIKPKKVMETTGAGDAYRAGMIYGILNGKTLAEACRIGAYVGAKNVEMIGGQTYIISKSDIERCC